MADSDTVITPYRDGPLLVRGAFKLRRSGRQRDRARRARDHDGAVPLRQVAAAAVLRRHAQRDPLPGAEQRRERPHQLGALELSQARARESQRARHRRSHAAIMCRAQRPSIASRARAPHRTSAPSFGSCLARPPARSTAATLSCTASATTWTSKNRQRVLAVAEPPQAGRHSAGWAPRTSSRTARGGRRSRRAGAGAGRRTTSG